MKTPGRTSVVGSIVLWGLGFASLVTGMNLVGRGGAAADAGTQTTGGLGAFFVVIGILTILGVPAGWGIRAIVAQARRYAAWKETLTPQERAVVRGAETAALIGAAVAGHEMANGYGHRVRARYDATNAAADAWQQQSEAFYQQVNGGAGQPGTQFQVPGQPGPWGEPTPGQYQP